MRPIRPLVVAVSVDVAAGNMCERSLYSVLRLRGTTAVAAFVCTAMHFSAADQSFSGCYLYGLRNM